MTDIADASPEQISTLLKTISGGTYFRPYASNTIEVSFLTSAPTYQGDLSSYNGNFRKTEGGSPSFGQFNAAEQLKIKAAFSAISKVANIDFVYTENPSPGAIRLGKAEVFIPGKKSVGGANIQTGGDRQQPLVNDIFLPLTTGSNDLDFGRPGFLDLLHEIGHALGLTKHPSEEDFSKDIQLSRAVSMVSYADWLTPRGTLQDRKGMTPLILDILALQTLWGLPEPAHGGNPGNTTYTFSPDSSPAITDSSDTTLYKTQTRAIWDSGGTDTFSASAYSATEGVIIELRPGYLSSIGGTKNIGIAFNAQIENSIGGQAMTF